MATVGITDGSSTENRVALRIFAFSDDLLGSANRDGFLTVVNPAWERTLGFTPEVLMAQPFIEFVHPADRESTIEEMARLAAEGAGSDRFENRFAVREGGWRWLRWQIEMNDDGYSFVARDITDEIATSQRRYLLANLVEGVDDAIMTKTLDGVVTSWNGASEDLYGYTAREAMGKSITDLIVPADLSEEPAEIIGRLLGGEGVRQYTTRRQHKDGRVMNISLTASLLRDAEDVVVGSAVVSRDLAELDLDDDDARARGELDTLA